MNDDDVFDKWLNQANKELIESISNSLDVEDTLATVKDRAATDSDETPADHRVAEIPVQARERVLSLSVIRAANRPRKAVSVVRGALVGLSQSRSVFAIIGATVAIGIFVLFSPLPGYDSPILSLPVFADRAAHVGAHDGTGEDTGHTGQGDARQPDPTQPRPPLVPPVPGGSTFWAPAPGKPAPGQPEPVAPGSAQPTPAEWEPAPSATEESAPGTPSEPPGVQIEKTVELSTQEGHESVQIDWWQRVDNEPDDLHMDPDGIYTALDAKLSLVDPSVEPTYHHCAQNTAWINQVNFAALQTGSRLCAKSRTGRYAVLTVIALPRPEAPSDRFVFHGKTWQLAGEPRAVESPGEEPPAEEPPAGQPPARQPTPRQTPPAEPTAGQPTPPPPTSG